MLKRFVGYDLSLSYLRVFTFVRGWEKVKEEGYIYFLTPSVLKNDKYKKCYWPKERVVSRGRKGEKYFVSEVQEKKRLVIYIKG